MIPHSLRYGHIYPDVEYQAVHRSGAAFGAELYSGSAGLIAGAHRVMVECLGDRRFRGDSRMANRLGPGGISAGPYLRDLIRRHRVAGRRHDNFRGFVSCVLSALRALDLRLRLFTMLSEVSFEGCLLYCQ